MHFSNIALATLAVVTPFASAVGNAVVENLCDGPVFLWSVGSSTGPQLKIKSGGVYSEEFRHDDVSGGVALKITRTEGGLFDGSPQLNYAYSLTNGGSTVFYDLSNVFGNGFEGSALLVDPSVDTCPEIFWPNGVSGDGSNVKDCTSDCDVTLTLCAQE